MARRAPLLHQAGRPGLTTRTRDARVHRVAAPAPSSTASAGDGRARAIGVALYVALVAIGIRAFGLPLDRERVMLFVAGAVTICLVGRRPADVVRLVRDWLPLVGVLLLYDLSRDVADDLGRPVAVTAPIRADEILFGGTVPTVWLQERLYRSTAVAWWEVPVALVYVSHFIVPFVLAGRLWLVERPAWIAYVGRLVALSFLGVVTFVLYPAAPPWLASQLGEIGEVTRTAARGLERIGLDTPGALLERGQAAANPVAAIPSLHTGYAVLVALTLARRVGPAWRPVIWLYPVAMGLTLVLTGEHYVVDVAIGAAYVAMVDVAAGAFERRRGLPDDPGYTPSPALGR